jgi:hypothetical protein
VQKKFELVAEEEKKGSLMAGLVCINVCMEQLAKRDLQKLATEFNYSVLLSEVQSRSN